MPPRLPKNTQNRVSKRAPSKPQKRAASSASQASSSPFDSSSPLYFWGHKNPQKAYLSQWYPCAFKDDVDSSIVYPTAEHYMMYHKALLFSDTAVAAQILTTSSPKAVKGLGRKVANFDDKVWAAHREDIVCRGNRLKFTNPADPDDEKWTVKAAGGKTLRELLLETGDREIVEASPFDRIWGIGFAGDKAEANRDRWGLNLLGKALMDVRRQLREEEAKVGVKEEGKKEAA